MSELSVSEARDQFPAVLNEAQDKPVRITRHGVDVAVIVNPSLFESLIEAKEELEDIAAFDEVTAPPPVLDEGGYAVLGGKWYKYQAAKKAWVSVKAPKTKKQARL